MRVEQLVAAVADQLGATIEAIPSGGEFGAAFVRDRGGDRMVLKAVPGRHRAKKWERGILVATCLRERGYPAPRYRGMGVVGDAVWSLQELLPGGVPSRLEALHVERLVSLAARHADAAVGLVPVGSEAPKVEVSLGSAQQLKADPRTAVIGEQVEKVLERTKGVISSRARTGDACHGDFHHRNLLVDGDGVVGVFDWEGASCGDWRFDLATLAFWSHIAAHQFSDAARALAIGRAVDLCEPDLLALFSGCLAARCLTFFMSHRPEDLDIVLRGVASIAEWW